MELKRPEFPDWPAFVGIACFVLMGLIIWQGRPQTAPQATEWCPPGQVNVSLTCNEFGECWPQCQEPGPVWSAVVHEPVNYQRVEASSEQIAALERVMVEELRAACNGPLEDRIVRRLQQWLDRNEANRPLPVFRK